MCVCVRHGRSKTRIDHVDESGPPVSGRVSAPKAEDPRPDVENQKRFSRCMIQGGIKLSCVELVRQTQNAGGWAKPLAQSFRLGCGPQPLKLAAIGFHPADKPDLHQCTLLTILNPRLRCDRKLGFRTDSREYVPLAASQPASHDAEQLLQWIVAGGRPQKQPVPSITQPQKCRQWISLLDHSCHGAVARLACSQSFVKLPCEHGF